ncbi:potassium channel family protein [Actinomycetospora corticicola]|uniref:Voltage-gated potassium channel Kch n=1 Tax=Actinomycetospora corticicola TaxID=663602 RepID=A0A7Y9DVG3_9PSEU|nr:potassium channel family protein [Actinomycetospora corticicola]NYD36149.1 voltage-gated potassium channel Kch [Actinomycetospora corticicola]
MTWRALRDITVLVVLYYVVPLGGDRADPMLWVRLAVVLVGFVVLGRAIARRVARHSDDTTSGRGVEGLLVAVVAGVLFAAAADYLVATTQQGQFDGLATRTDALYFALSTLTTVGFGDIHPVGQMARAVVIAQLLFDVIVIATAAGVIARQARRRAGTRQVSINVERSGAELPRP